MKLAALAAALALTLAPTESSAWQCPCGYSGPEQCWDQWGNQLCDTNDMVWGWESRRRLLKVESSDSNSADPLENMTSSEWGSMANATLEKYRPAMANGTAVNGTNASNAMAVGASASQRQLGCDSCDDNYLQCFRMNTGFDQCDWNICQCNTCDSCQSWTWYGNCPFCACEWCDTHTQKPVNN